MWASVHARESSAFLYCAIGCCPDEADTRASQWFAGKRKRADGVEEQAEDLLLLLLLLTHLVSRDFLDFGDDGMWLGCWLFCLTGLLGRGKGSLCRCQSCPPPGLPCAEPLCR